MPLYRLRAVWTPRPTFLQDRTVWSWGCEAAATPSAADLKTKLTTALSVGSTTGQRLKGVLRKDLTGWEFAVYPAAGGEALDVVSMTDVVASSATAANAHQVAAVVSSQLSTSRGVKPKGRTFYGPFSTVLMTTTATGLISPDGVTALGNFSLSWHAGQVALGITPVVLAADGLTSRGNIVSYAVDNSPDVMRSRKVEATTLTYYTP